MIVLAGFGAWSLCAVVCLTFFALVARRGQLEDQLALQLVQQQDTKDETVRPALPAGLLGAGLKPRGALDDELVAKESARV